MERCETSGSNSLSQPGKLSISSNPHPPGTEDGQKPVGCPWGGGGGEGGMLRLQVILRITVLQLSLIPY